MFLKIYSIEDTETNIKYPNTYILRFSGIDTKTGYFNDGNKEAWDIKKNILINPKDIKDINIKRTKNIKLFTYLIKNIERNKRCYPEIFNPWHEYINNYKILPNYEVIFVFNIESNKVLGYCKLNYGTHNYNTDKTTGIKKYYTALEIEYLITLKLSPIARENNNNKYIGAVILYFIKTTYVNNIYIAITNIVQGQSHKNDVIIECKNIDIIYLYALTVAIPYYDRVPFFITYKSAIEKVYNRFKAVYKPEYNIPEIFTHVYYAIPNITNYSITSVNFDNIFYGIYDKADGEISKVIQDENKIKYMTDFMNNELDVSCYANETIDKDNNKTIKENITNKEKFNTKDIIFLKDPETYNVTRSTNVFRKSKPTSSIRYKPYDSRE